jgi:hypothetical protein
LYFAKPVLELVIATVVVIERSGEEVCETERGMFKGSGIGLRFSLFPLPLGKNPRNDISK